MLQKLEYYYLCDEGLRLNRRLKYSVYQMFSKSHSMGEIINLTIKQRLGNLLISKLTVNHKIERYHSVQLCFVLQWGLITTVNNHAVVFMHVFIFFRIRHFPIEATKNGQSLAIGKLTFPNLMDIVDYYQKNPLFFSEHKEPITLGKHFTKDRVQK